MTPEKVSLLTDDQAAIKRMASEEPGPGPAPSGRPNKRSCSRKCGKRSEEARTLDLLADERCRQPVLDSLSITGVGRRPSPG